MTSPALTIPLVGRTADLSALGALLDAGEARRGGSVFLTGEGGVGKTRLAKALGDQAVRRGWKVAVGRAYPVEAGVPYALFSDALLPILRQLDPATLSVMTRGGSAELAYLFPALAPESGTEARPAARGDPAEFKARLLWNFAQFLGRYAARQPLLLVLENLQWADSSSLELLHFVARQVTGERIVILCTYNEAEREQNPVLRPTEQSLVTLGVARVHRLEPLSRESIDELVRRTFDVDSAVTREFTALLFGWTRGNPFFVEETLKTLVESGRLHQREGTWLGWELQDLALPRSVRDALLVRLDRLAGPARSVANLAAVIGTRASFDMLASVSAMPRPDLLGAIDELRRERVFSEAAEDDAVVYDFSHPLVQQTLYGELGLARARLLHGTIGAALESFYGPHAELHADELAFHFSRANASDLAPKAVRYLSLAGRLALSKYANREAADYLSAALEQLDRTQADAGGEVDRLLLVEELAQARQRLGDYDAARRLWDRARQQAESAGLHHRLAAIERRTGLACYWSGHYEEALAHYEAGLGAARNAGDDALFARISLARGMCLQELGRPDDAQREVHAALVIAERLGDTALLARAHRALLLLYAWTGPVALAREHGEQAIALADQSAQRSVSCTAHWALAILAGFTGNATDVARHLAEAERLADEIRSPLLRVWTAEVAIEYAAGIGDWDAGVGLAERTIALARSLGQRTLLPRLLVWSALLYLGRGEIDRAKRYIDEAWMLSGADRGGTDRPLDVHTVVPAHIGLAAYHLATGDHKEAIRIGEAGLAIADRSGYVVWAIHRLLPVIAEAALWSTDLERAERLGTRLRRDSAALGQRLGLAWADACEALVAMLRGESQRAVGLLRAAAEELDAIPFVADAARLRRQLARALTQTGDRDGAMRELRRAHDVFARLGAEIELVATRNQLRELGARPPARVGTTGAGGLTGREVEIVRLVADRKSNKEIATALGISPRTVSTHLSNIFGKLSMSSRVELADYARQVEFTGN